MSSLNWNGIAHIDMRYDRDDDTYKIIEINPRYWFSLEASMLAGVNFPYLHLLSSLKEEVKFSTYNCIKVITLKGFLKSLRNTPLLLFRFRFLWNHSSIRFILKDPFPIFMQFEQGIKKRLIKKR